jgi:glycosyltransferase involved in cell wall biosynthesis
VLLVLGAGYHPKKDDNGDYRAYYEALRARATAMANVDFAGFIESADLDRYIAAADACIFRTSNFKA